MSTTETKRNYEPIPSVDGRGYTALTIYPPHSFMQHDASWGIFVGGCGVGSVGSEGEARALLLQKALEYCEREIARANTIATHYRTQRERLTIVGLTGT